MKNDESGDAVSTLKFELGTS